MLDHKKKGKVPVELVNSILLGFRKKGKAKVTEEEKITLTRLLEPIKLNCK